MPEPPKEGQPPSSPPELDRLIGGKAARMIEARSREDHVLWFGLGVFGLVGWSLATPILVGIAVGAWLDTQVPTRISWTLTMLFAGAALGASNAWYWVSHEQAAIARKRNPSERRNA